jgi:propanediol dehydratase small subunit
MSNDHYPLIDQKHVLLHAASGKRLDDINLAATTAGTVTAEDLRISRETLLAQAAIAAESGYPQLAANLTRAAELTGVPNDELLAMYELLRPERATRKQLIQLAEQLETTYSAPENGRFVREAAEVYGTRGLLRKPPT